MAESLFAGILRSIQTAFEEDDALFANKHYEQLHVRSIQRQIEKLGSMDYDGFLGELDENVVLEIHAPPEFPFVRRAKGLAAVKAAVMHNFAQVVAQAPQIFTVVAQGNVVDMTLRETGRIKSTDVAYDVTAVQQFVFRNGKVVRVREIVSYTTLDA